MLKRGYLIEDNSDIDAQGATLVNGVRIED